MRILEAMRELGSRRQILSGFLFGTFRKVVETPQRETTPFYPRSPYAAAKAYAFYITKNYREAYGMFAVNGILFNHESPRRGETFVTRKISRAAARIKVGLQECLYLGNLDAKRDWGFAGDYVEAMWLMMQANEPDDYVIATGESLFRAAVLRLLFRRDWTCRLHWEGSGENEVGLDPAGHDRGQVDPKYFRPAEVDMLLGDPAKAKKNLGWTPKVSAPELAVMMVTHDMALAKRKPSGMSSEHATSK